MASPLVAIVGETASGKSALALKIAGRYDGEIICADSRTVYKGMDIGTAKPSLQERQAIPHHGLDVVEPGGRFSAAEFKDLTQKIIKDISKRGKLPILVGGTGLYIDAVLYDYEFLPPPDPAIRHRYEQMSRDELRQELCERHITAPTNEYNKRHLVRALETGGEVSRRSDLRPNTCIVGLSVDRDVLRQRITSRVDEMIRSGFVEEVRKLLSIYGSEHEAFRAPGYKPFIAYLQGALTIEQARDLFIRNDMALAKRQRTWFKRNKSIQWSATPEEAESIITNFLGRLR